ncbi:hypothetical protein MMC07_002280 [Pseudocyphellaria aurata]|nr:hypothetical protein [Pseudocyphellaria aurata]
MDVATTNGASHGLSDEVFGQVLKKPVNGSSTETSRTSLPKIIDVATTNGASNGLSNEIFDQLSNYPVNGTLTETSPSTLAGTTNKTSAELLNGTVTGISNGTPNVSTPQTMDVTATNGVLKGVSNEVFNQVSNGAVNESLTQIAPGTVTETLNGTSRRNTAALPSTLRGKVALITGASRGIGAGIAIELGARQASVIVNYVKGRSAAEEVVAAIEKFGSKAIAVQADVSKVPEITKLFDAAKAHFGKIDIVVSNSGTESFDKTEDITEERFDFVFGLNVRAQFFVGQHAYTYCEPGGRLILMSSIAAGLLGVADHSLYSGSKSAVNGITKSFATDFGKKGMTCNAIAPGGIKSDMFTQVAWRYIPGADGSWTADAIETAMANHCPLKRCALPVDVARVVAFLASEDGGWVNGQIITISGGSGQ